MESTTSRVKKKARVEKPDAEKYRKGVTSRVKSDCISRSWLVEMRFPKKVVKMKVCFGTYDTKEKAMIARDYVAFLRNSTGLEKFPAVGGYYDYKHRVDPTAIFEFFESPGIFDKLDSSKARCDEFKRLLALYSLDARKTFVENAKADILLAIESFQSTYPEKFGKEFDGRELPMVDPVDGEAPATDGIRASWTAGCNDGEGSAVARVKVGITLEVFAPPEILLLSPEEIRSVVHDNLGLDNLIIQALMNKVHQKQLPEKMLAEMAPCTIDPNDYPALE